MENRINENVMEKLFGGQTLLCSVPFDLSSDGKFESGIFAFSKDSIAVVKNGEAAYKIKIDNVYRICVGELVGNGVVEAFTANGRVVLCRFSMTQIDKFSAAVQMITELINGDSVKPYEYTAEEKVCPKCKRPYMRGSQICRHCSDKKGMIKRLWQISKPCRPLYIILLVLFWFTSGITVVTPMLNRKLVNDVLTAVKSSTNMLLFIVALMLLASIATMLINIFRDIISVKASNLLVRDLRNEVYSKVQKLPLSYAEDRKAGDLMQRINNDTQRIQTFIQDIGLMAINELFLFITIAVIVFTMNPRMALLIFVPIPLAVFLIGKIRKSIRRRYARQWRKLDLLTNRLTDVLNGIKVVKVFGRENDEIEKFQENAATVKNITRKNEQFVYTVFPLIKFVMGFGSHLVLLYGGLCVINEQMSLGELVQFSMYGSYLYSRIEWLSNLPRHFMMAMTSSQRVFEILDKDDEILSGEIKKKQIDGNFEFDNVSFGYKSYRRVLNNITESVKQGEMIGIVGHSGAGKSTLINLIMRLYAPDKGDIKLDGRSVKDYSDESYKSFLGIVLQESYLFSGTIFDNIKYAAPNATVEDCIIAAKRANAHDFIMKLPDGYNTYVGEKGYKLSGGERQRISIARAIAANPQIVILDEATASVDTETECKIQEAMENITNGKTVFAIAHRLSTLRNADRLIVIEDGSIAEEGTHAQLIKKNGIYASLLKAQREMITIDDTHKKED